MSLKKSFYESVMPKIYGIGASVVILGALFKLQHWSLANEMLIAGMLTEVVVFFLFAFQPTEKEYNWEKVYPELLDEKTPVSRRESVKQPGSGIVQELDKMLSESNIDKQLIDNLGQGLRRLGESASGFADLSQTLAASEDYILNIKSASNALVRLTDSVSETASALSGIAGVSTESKEYHEQVQHAARNLRALNAVYESELQDAGNHLKIMNKFYGDLSAAMADMSEVVGHTEEFKKQMARLSQNIANLNHVYGNMLSAMKS